MVQIIQARLENGACSDSLQLRSAPICGYARKRKPHSGCAKLPDHLPVEEIVLEPEGDTEGLEYIGEK